MTIYSAVSAMPWRFHMVHKHFTSKRRMLAPVVGLASLLLSACFDNNKISNQTGSETQPNTQTQTDSAPPPRGASSLVPGPTVTGPIEGGVRGRAWGEPVAELTGYRERDYMVEEYFFSGTADGRDANGVLDGTHAGYTSRMLVVRPRSAKHFDGTVLVEWFNVTAEMDLSVIFGLASDEILRSGHAFVGVSAQQVGVSASPVALKFWDPVRYAPLSHPGDAYAVEIYAQAARSLFARQGPAPLGPLVPRHVIAMGESQSGAYMAQYANVVQREHHLFDGILVHTWPKPIAEDVEVPVLMLLTEAEAEGVTSPLSGQGQSPSQGSSQQQLGDIPGFGLTRIGSAGYPSNDHSHLRVWELAGGSHYDTQAIGYMSAQISRDLTAPIGLSYFFEFPLMCGYPPNRLGLGRPTIAAIHALNNWITNGTPAPSLPRLERMANGHLVRDDAGLAQGGIRMPNVAAPVGVNRGDDCLFFGSYRAFSDADVRARYPTREEFLTHSRDAAAHDVAEGSLLPEEADKYIKEAEAVNAW